MDDEHKKLLELISKQLEQLQNTAQGISNKLSNIDAGIRDRDPNTQHSYLKAIYEMMRDKKGGLFG